MRHELRRTRRTAERTPGLPTERIVARERREDSMIETILVVLLILWLLGLVTSTTFGGLIHVLLVIALILIVLRLVRGRRIA